MKRLVLLLALFLSFTVSAQKMSITFLQGTWTPQTYAPEIVFLGSSDRDFKIIMNTSDEYREPIDVLYYQLKDNNLYIQSLYKPNNWKCIGKFIIIDNNTMVVDYVSDAPAVVIYKRKINNLNKNTKNGF